MISLVFRVGRWIKRFPLWIREKEVNKLIFIRAVLFIVNMLIFFGAVVYVVLKWRG